jgi:transposase
LHALLTKPDPRSALSWIAVCSLIPYGARHARLYVRLRDEDRLLLRERATARGMAPATYVSVLVRSHLRTLAPLPKEEFSALKRSVAELGTIGRNLNQIAKAANQSGKLSGPDREDLRAMLRVAEGLRDHVKALLKANQRSTTTLFAALNVANGTVLTQCKPKHRHQEFLAFLRHIEANVPEHLDVHPICDNYGTHKHAKVRVWLARRPRFHLHFILTYSSWLNQVERWFALITNQAIRRGSFDSVTDLKRKISEFVEHYNQHPRPFMWTATAESILDKLERLCKVISGTSH